jgi:alpha-glucosidase
VIYEIYLRSFQDSNGDGVGDLNGIVQRLDYLESLGVDAIWITPLYPSPQVDAGYDISDYRAIDPCYGTLADFDRLIAEAGKRGIRVLLDMVLNHTSDQHPWFLEAARSRTSPWHELYVWSDGRTDASGRRVPPNNWVSLFGGPAWEYVPAVDQFYYHKYYRQQPDLNWRNPKVERAMFSVMRSWLNRGVAGFRLDAITALFEDEQLRDEPVLGGTTAHGDPNLNHIYTDSLPETHGVIRRLRAMLDAYPGQRVLIGETYLPRTADLDAWYGGAHHNELHLPMDTLVGLGSELDATTFRQRLIEAATEIHHSQPLLVFDNHDVPRSWDRYGDGVHDAEIARIIAALLFTARAAVLLYQGEEIGQRTATPARVEDVRDPMGVSGWPREKGRDGERTPMQWDASNPQAGFSSNRQTWLPVPPGYESINVQSETADPASLLNWHRHLIAMRRSYAALRSGRLIMLGADNASVLSYARVAADGDAMLVALNMSAAPRRIEVDLAAAGVECRRLVTLLSSPAGIPDVHAGAALTLPPYAAWVAAVRAERPEEEKESRA